MPRARLVGVFTSLVLIASFAAAVPVSAQQRVRVGGEIKEPKKIKDVKPVYPEDAKAAGVQGIVIIEALIGTDGAVKEAKVLRGVQMLDQAALEAVMQWRYTPTLLNGEPVELIMTVTVTFTLSGAARAPAGGSALVARFDAPTDATESVWVPEGAVRVGGAIKAPKKLKNVMPKWPAEQAEPGQQIVILEVVIGTDGRVAHSRVLRSAGAFAAAALEAVKQWEYEPTLLNGAPVPVVMTVTVTFTRTSN